MWKFGGTCVAGPERLREVSRLIKQEVDSGANLAIVVSAMGSSPDHPVKITDQLLDCLAKAVGKQMVGNDGFREGLLRLEDLHIQAARELLLADGEATSELFENYVNALKRDVHDLTSMLNAITIVGVSSQAFSDFVVGHGELWNARLLASYLQTCGMADASMVDARDILVVSPSDQDTVEVDYDTSSANLDNWHAEQTVGESSPSPLIVTGFVARQSDGVPTTLRRNGSDYSGTIFAALLHAKSITIWTDVDGVFTADPRKVTEAEPLKHLTYNEAWELSYFGANVLHPRSTLPAMKNNIPIHIKNLFNLDAEGTLIDGFTSMDDFEGVEGGGPKKARGERWRNVVKGIATIEDCCLINIEGTGMVGVPGTASRIFSCIRDAGINVIMISQGSSEHSVCFAVKSEDASLACSVLEEEFQQYIRNGLLDTISTVDQCTILAAVGSKLQHAVGASAHMFTALAEAGVNIRATAQGCSEHNVTVVIDSKDSTKALGAVHSAFYLSDTTVCLGVVGPGLVGKALLEQFRSQLAVLKEERHIDVRIFGIASSRRMLLSETPISLDTWEADFEANSVPCDLSLFKEHIASRSIPKFAIIDCTASDAVPEYYEEWMRAGVNIVTPNKKLNSGPLDRYKTIKAIESTSFVHYYYEATVGAGLPVIATIKYLQDTGDAFKQVEGIFSGTLSYIFNNFKEGTKFSDIVKEAKENGFTEPDPRDDLSGMDVARKVTTLARECGLDLELEDVPVQSLVPSELASCASSEEFMERLPDFDDAMAKRQADAEAKGQCLRYVGLVDVRNGRGSVELREYPKSHPFAQLSGTDNIILCQTTRYDPQPLVITGPGAGADVTAGGVFSDLIRLCENL